MDEPRHIDVLTIFPRMLAGFLEESILKRAVRKGCVRFRIVNLRDFTSDRHQTTDDRPYGGGPGMIMMPGPIFAAVEAVRSPGARVILMTPQGERFHQARAAELARERHLIFVCGHYEGVDERVRERLATDEISIGDYVLTNGVLPAAVVIDLPNPDGPGRDELEDCLALVPGMPVVVHSAAPRPDAGLPGLIADAYVEKSADLSALLAALECVLSRTRVL